MLKPITAPAAEPVTLAEAMRLTLKRIASRPDGTFGVLLAEPFIHHYAGWEV